MYLLAGKHVVNELVQLVPVLIDGLNDEGLLVCREFFDERSGKPITDQAISIFFCPFSSIHILATVSPRCDFFLLPRRTTWMCRRFSVASAGNTESPL